MRMDVVKKSIWIGLAALAVQLPITSLAQMDDGPATEKKYGVGLPRDHATTLFTDDQYPKWRLRPDQRQYADINGMRMKKDIIALAQVSKKYRDTVNSQWWGRFPGTSADFEGAKYMLDEFKRLGLQTTTVPFNLPTDYRPTSWDGSYTYSGGTVKLNTLMLASGTKPTPAEGITAEAVWVGVGG